MPRRSEASKSKKSSRKQAQSAHEKAGLIMPVSRFMRMLKRDRLASRFGKGAAVAIASAIEYMASEIAETAGNNAEQEKKKRIGNRHLSLGIQSDVELAKVFQNFTVREGGKLAHIESKLLPNKKGAKQIEATQEV